MTEREAFIEAIAADPADDTARLAFADWLQEHGEDERAEFIRLQCEIARRSRRPDGVLEFDYDSYPSNPNPKDPARARAVSLVLNHWPEWFGGILAAGEMPEPMPTVPPKEAWGEWRYGHYLLTEGHALPYLQLQFEWRLDEPPHLTQRFLNHLHIDRGFVTGLRAALAFRSERCSLAAALRLEPIDTLTLQIDPNPDHWAALSHPILRRIQELNLSLARYSEPVADFSDAIGALLNDPVLTGVRALALDGEEDWIDEFPTYAVPPAVVAVLVSSGVARRLTSLHLSVNTEGLLALAETNAPPALRTLKLVYRPHGDAGAIPGLDQYRDQLEQLACDALDTVLTAGRPWARLASLQLGGMSCPASIGARECEALARPDMFPALTELRFSPGGKHDAGALARAIRAGRFPHLTVLNVLGNLGDDNSGAAVALAEAVAPTTIRVLDLRGVFVPTEEVYHRVRALLGDRVFLNQPPDPNDPIPF